MTRKNQVLPKSFEEAMAELESILKKIESGQATLEESLVQYERGNYLLKFCRDVLGQAEKQIELLSKGESGELESKAMEGEK